MASCFRPSDGAKTHPAPRRSSVVTEQPLTPAQMADTVLAAGARTSTVVLQSPPVQSAAPSTQLDDEDTDDIAPLPLSARSSYVGGGDTSTPVLSPRAPPNTPAVHLGSLTSPLVVGSPQRRPGEELSQLRAFDAAIERACSTLETFVERMQHMTPPPLVLHSADGRVSSSTVNDLLARASVNTPGTGPAGRLSCNPFEDKAPSVMARVSMLQSADPLPASTQFVAFDGEEASPLPPPHLPQYSGQASSALVEEQAAVLRTLHGALRAREDDLSAVLQELETLRSQCAGHQQRCDAAESAYTQLMDAAVHVRTRFAAASDEIRRLRTAMQASNAEAAGLRGQVDALRAEVAAERRRAGDAQANTQAVHEELQDVTTQYAELSRAHRTALASAAALHEMSQYQAMQLGNGGDSWGYSNDRSGVIAEPRRRVSAIAAPSPRQSSMPQYAAPAAPPPTGPSVFVPVPATAAHRAHPSAAKGMQVSFNLFTGGPARAVGEDSMRLPAAVDQAQQPQQSSAPARHEQLLEFGEATENSQPVGRPTFSSMPPEALEQLINGLNRERDALTEELRHAGPTSGRTMAARTHRVAMEARVEQVGRELAAARVEQRAKSSGWR
jgi:hypothetical protein